MSPDRPTLTKVTIPVAVIGVDSEVAICPYEAFDAILDAQERDKANWLEDFQHWIASQLKVAPEKIHRQQVVAFNDIVILAVERLREDHKKKVSEIVDWLLSTQVSPAISEDGTKEPKTLGSTMLTP